MANDDLAKQLLDKLDHFEHVLPAQASIRDFVHHNTLHGFEHLKFEDALKAANQLTGAYGYWPQQKFREQYKKGRITESDLNVVLEADASLSADQVVFSVANVENSSANQEIKRADIYRIALLYPLKQITPCQLKWKVEEAQVLTSFQADVAESARQAFLSASASVSSSPKSAINDLWSACVEVLGLDDAMLHPEQMLELSPEQAEKMLDALHKNESVNESLNEKQQAELEEQQQAWKELDLLATKAGQNDSKFNLGRLIKTLTGVDIDHRVSAPTQSKIDPLIRNDAWHTQNDLFAEVGDTLTLRGLLKKLTHIDLHDEIVPSLQRYVANWLDEGFAAWHESDAQSNQAQGFYQSWKKSAALDESWLFKDMPEWQGYIDSLPDNSLDAVMAELTRMDIPHEKWAAYIERSALELPGWSGMFYWRHHRPDYQAPSLKFANNHADMMDYLAVRLVMEHLFVRRTCRKLWLNEGNLSSLRGYFHRHHDEFLVRYNLYNKPLPEYLIGHSQQLLKQHASHVYRGHEWQLLAHMIWTWQQCSSAPVSAQSDSKDHVKNQDNSQQKVKCNVVNSNKVNYEGWVLFRLAQHLSLPAEVIRALNVAQIKEIFECVTTLQDQEKSGFLLLKAYEHHYREKVFSVVANNHGRGTWANRDDARPEAQIIFCMDDREEGLRRHLEYLNPAIETLGAAAFFGVVMHWKGLDEEKSVELCPVVVRPVHEVDEVVEPSEHDQLAQHQKRYASRIRLGDLFHQETRRDMLSSTVLMAFAAPAALLTLLGKVFVPRRWGLNMLNLKGRFDLRPATRVTSCEMQGSHASQSQPHLQQQQQQQSKQAEPTVTQPKIGFSVEEQADIVESFLQNNGLLSGLSQFVVLLGHYSRNQNNPHTAAYGCGACGGKFSGPNGRVFAAMANNPEVRQLLATRGLIIPADCWFLGGEHDTCNEAIAIEDTDLVPEGLRQAFAKLQNDLRLASKHSAHERCRKLASAPQHADIDGAAKHMQQRALDFSQARPELGHATIAAGFVGRRHLSQGTFMDRRCFLISYDAKVDPEGEYLERILLSAGPVGAGINLEYYFSSVNNEKFGCGSKIVHNLAGLFGVMEGCAGDLRTGLPLQMIEIHEPMRLQLMVEAKTEVLTKIYQRQESIQQLVGNGWLLLSAKDPESAEIQTFDPESGWQVWQGLDQASADNMPVFKQSADWYQGHYDHLPPVLLEKPKAKDHQKITNRKKHKEVTHA